MGARRSPILILHLDDKKGDVWGYFYCGENAPFIKFLKLFTIFDKMKLINGMV